MAACETVTPAGNKEAALDASAACFTDAMNCSGCPSNSRYLLCLQVESRWDERRLHAPQPAQNIHRENGDSSSGGDTGERLFRARFPVSEAIAAHHNCDQARNLGDGSGETGLESRKTSVEGDPLCAKATAGNTNKTQAV